jgi:hypothetical protein
MAKKKNIAGNNLRLEYLDPAELEAKRPLTTREKAVQLRPRRF